MSRISPRWYPRARLYERPRPEHPPFLFEALSDGMRQQGRVRPGRFSNLHWLYLRDDVQQIDSAPGVSRDFRPAVLLLSHGIRWENTRAGRNGTGLQWINESHTIPAYATILSTQKAQLQNEIARLQAIEEPDDDDRQQLADAQNILDELTLGSAYLRTGYNLMGTGASGIFWGASLAPARVTSGFTLSRDRSITIGLQRWEPPRELHQNTYSIEFGRGATWYALRIGDDGNSSTFYHYRNMSAARRDSLRAQLETVLDNGRLTAADYAKLLVWQEEEQAIRARAKRRDQDERKLTAEESTRIAQLDTLTRALKDSKRGLTNADEERVRQLKNELYLAEEEFQLVEGSRSLLGRALTLTFRFLKSGYVVVATDAGQSGRGEWLYENKRITGLEPPRYQSGLPDQCFINLHSDGGKWMLTYGHPLHALRGSQWSQPFDVPFEFDPDTVRYIYEADASYPGCQIGIELLQLSTHRYQVRVDLLSGVGVSDEAKGQGTPELYWLEVHIPAGPVPDYGEPLWNSQTDGANASANSGNSITEVLLKSEDERSLHCEAHISDPNHAANLPQLIGGAACDLELLDRSDESTAVLLTKGMVACAPELRVKRVESEEGFVTVPDVGHGVKLDVVGLESFLNREIAARFSGHNMFPNDYLRLYALDGGEHPDYVLIPAGDIGIPRIRKAKPGEYPSCKPSPSTRYLEWMRDVARNHCPGWMLASVPGGLDLIRLTARVRPELAYGIPPEVPVDSPLCLRDQLNLRQDLSEYVTTVTAIGGINPLTGQRYAATETRPEAYTDGFQDSMYWINGDVPLTLDADDSLTSDLACRKRAREELDRRGRPPWFASVALDYDPSLRPGDRVTIYNIAFDCEEIDMKGLNPNGGETPERMAVEFRLAVDVRPPNP